MYKRADNQIVALAKIERAEMVKTFFTSMFTRKHSGFLKLKTPFA
jgi:hypothetical protein